MFKYRAIIFLLLIVLFVTPAYCQIKLDSRQIKVITGTVTQTDFVGNVISILSTNQQQMAFYVPTNAVITQNAHEIGLMDIRISDPLTIQYYMSSPGKYNVLSIMDNKPAVTE